MATRLVHGTGLRLICLSMALPLGVSNAATTHTPGEVSPESVSSVLSMAFEARGKPTGLHSNFVARGRDHWLFLDEHGALLVLNKADKNEGTALRLRVTGARPVGPVGEGLLAGKANRFKGNKPEAWDTAIKRYESVRYPGLLPGVDLLYYSNEDRLEYDFVLSPGAQPGDVHFTLDGANSIRLSAGGDLLVELEGGTLVIKRPFAWQKNSRGDRKEIASAFTLDERGEVGFQIAAYDTGKELVIDPVLQYSTYLGGQLSEHAHDIATGPGGHLYITGKTVSADFTAASTCVECSQASSVPTRYDAFVARVDPSLSGAASLVYASYLGGNDIDYGLGIAVDTSGRAYLTGATASTTFPVSANPFQQNLMGSGPEFNAFVTRLSPDGTTIEYSSYLGGGNTTGTDIAVDSSGRAWIVGTTSADSASFPVVGGIQANLLGASDAFVSVLSPDGSTMVASSYLGGSASDRGTGIALDAEGRAWVVGTTFSDDFPTTIGAMHTTRIPSGPGTESLSNGFVSRLESLPGGFDLGISSYIAGGDSSANSVAVGPADEVFVVGGVSAPQGFPVGGSVQSTHGGSRDAFLLKLSPTASSVDWGSYLGGNDSDNALSVAVDSQGNPTVAGTTSSLDFPIERALQPSLGGGSDAFLSRFHSGGSTLLYSTFLGGINDEQGTGVALNANADAYLTGLSFSPDFPLTPSASQATHAGQSDAFLAAIVDPGCQLDSECDNGNICTDDSCDPTTGGCLHLANTTSCDDGEICTVGDACVAGSCQGGAALDCADGLFCTGVETCASQLGCQEGIALDPDDGIACTVDVCDETADALVNTSVDAACDDGLFCTGVETCNPTLGCQANAAPDPDDGVACTVDSCDEVADLLINTTDDAACDDGLFCNGLELCDSTEGCTAISVPDPDDGVACTVDICDENSDLLFNTPLDTLCDDDLYCNGIETCHATHGCQDNVDPDADDGVACTADSCNEASDSLVNTPVDVTCDDGKFCTGVETCHATLGCQDNPDPDPDDGIACTTDSCDHGLDSFVHSPVDILCDDGLFCTGVETCDATLGCQDNADPDPDDGLPCTVDSCEEASDSLVNTPVDAACDDGLFCTGAESCHATLGCQAGAAPDPNDGVVCTIDSCDEVGNSLTNAPDDSSCDDGLFCTGVETCDAALGCQNGAAPDPDDGVACTMDSCDEINDQLVNTINDDICDDAQFCNGAESCDAALGCQGGAAPDPDDAVACTVDSCDEINDQLVNTVDDGYCGDGVTCTHDTCDPSNGGCVNLADSSVCSDGNLCTDDVCDASSGCAHTHNSVPCEDGNPTTWTDQCSGGSCAGGPFACPLFPLTGCRGPTAPRKAKLLIRDKASDARDTLSWTWKEGAATAIDDFGDPRTGNDDFVLCLYDEEASVPFLVGQQLMTTGTLCGKKACWKYKRGSYRYRNRSGDVSDGIVRIKLSAGAEGKGDIKVSGKGAALGLPVLPLLVDERLTVQFIAENGNCWVAHYAADDVKSRNGKLNARSSSD
jgi:hypothetical protein